MFREGEITTYIDVFGSGEKKMIQNPENEEDPNDLIPEPSVEASMDEEGNPKPDKYGPQF